MAYFGRHAESFNASRTIKIPATETVENYTVYIIEVLIGPNKWTVRHRYSEFHELHEKLVSQYKLDKNLLPPKKLFGNQSETFVKKRQRELEIYLQTVLHHLSSVPLALALFLDFPRYEIHSITEDLAEDLYAKGDLILQSGETYHVTPLQLNAITTRLKLPEPTCESGDPKKDLGHVLDFVTRLKYLKVLGSDKPIGNSNMIMNSLSFDMNMFKALETLEMCRCNCAEMECVDGLKKTIRNLKIYETLRHLKDIMLLGFGNIEWSGSTDESLIVTAWTALTTLDLSHNSITHIDESVKLMPRCEFLDLSFNQMEDIQNLNNLSSLTHLDISHNKIRTLNSLHTKLGNIKSLNLAANKLESLMGFSKLYSLESVDLTGNEISQVLEVRHIACLPCVENLTLTHNPVTIVVDYRTKIFELFGDRASEVRLDGRKATQKELDTVAILLALQKSKQAKAKPRRQPAKQPPVASSVSVASGNSQRPTQSTSSSTNQNNANVTRNNQSGNHMSLEEKDAASVALAEQIRERLERLECLDQGNQQYETQPAEPASSDSSSTTSIESLGFMLPETLPMKSDTAFTTHLQSLLPNTQALTERSGVGRERERKREERAVHIMWCPAICYTDPYNELPACVFITTENMHVFQVQSLRGQGGMPNMEHIYCIPLLNVQQIVLGYQELYLRVEEAFVGPQGTFTFITYSPHKSRVFLDELKGAIIKATPEGEKYEEPHTMLNGETEMSLKAVLNRMEGYSDVNQVQLVLYMLTPDVAKMQRTYTTHSLVITYKYLYVVREDYILWPQPTFGIGPSTRPQFEIIHSLPVAGRITGIQMYDTDTYLHGNDSLPENFMATGPSNMTHFIGFGVRLKFELGPHQGQKDLDIRVPTSGMRDRFLATLTQVRREISERSPSPPKVKSSRKYRDGDTRRSMESLSNRSTDSQDSYASYPGRHTGAMPKSSSTGNMAAVVPRGASAMTSSGSQQDVTSPATIKAVTITHGDSKTVILEDIEVAEEVTTGSPASENNNAKTGCRDSKSPDPASPASTDTFHSVISQSAEIEPESVMNASSLCKTEKLEQQETNEITDSSFTEVENDVTGSNLKLCTDIDPILPPPTAQLRHVRVSPPIVPNVLQVPKTTANMTLNLHSSPYPSIKLLSRLSNEMQYAKYFRNLRAPMRSFASLSGEELVNFFHNNIARIGEEGEELKHILWTMVSPHINPRQEILTCVMLSSKALYFVSNDTPRHTGTQNKPAWRTHSRHVSDTALATNRARVDPHHLSGILLTTSGEADQKVVRCYFSLPLTELKQVNVGLFDQSFRLVGDESSKVFACTTRDNTLTETFMRQLMTILSEVFPSPTPEDPEREQDFYKMFNRYGRHESLSFNHPSRVRFIYPNEDCVSDLTYLLHEHIQGTKPNLRDINILLYLLVFQIPSPEGEGEINYARATARTLILSNGHVCLANEDHVSYPLPDFVKGLPDTSNYEVLEIRTLDSLRRVVVSDFQSRDLTLVFPDEKEEIVVDTRVEHFTPGGSCMAANAPAPDVKWALVIQNQKDRDRLLKQICRQWSEMHDGKELSVQVSS